MLSGFVKSFMGEVSFLSAFATRARVCVSRFKRDRAGDVAIMFGLVGVILFLCIGAAVDIGRWLHARSNTVSAVDAAVLAGARSMQLDNTDEAAAIAAANAYYDANTKSRLTLSQDTIQFQAIQNGTAVTATGSAFISTPFLSLAGIEELPLLKLSGAEFSRAVLAVGGNAEQSLEISMMLDVTGSMAGTKITDLKTAAKDLIDIVVWDNQGEYSSKIALAPFTAAVNAGALVNSVAFDPVSPLNFKFEDGNTRSWKKTGCVSERTGTEKYSDAAPSGTNKLPRVYSSSGVCAADASPVVPLTSDKTLLKTTIDNFVAAGTTSGHLGTAWAWYLLSPNWSSVLPATSAPKAYGADKLQKIAILMTDGEYNMQYCNSSSVTTTTGSGKKKVTTTTVPEGATIPDKNSNSGTSVSGDCSAPNGGSTSQARSMCTAMKAKGITVYTVGFALGGNQSAIDTLYNCATDPSHFYNADDGEQLKQSFRDIALKISSLYLAK